MLNNYSDSDSYSYTHCYVISYTNVSDIHCNTKIPFIIFPRFTEYKMITL